MCVIFSSRMPGTPLKIWISFSLKALRWPVWYLLTQCRASWQFGIFVSSITRGLSFLYIASAHACRYVFCFCSIVLAQSLVSYLPWLHSGHDGVGVTAIGVVFSIMLLSDVFHLDDYDIWYSCTIVRDPRGCICQRYCPDKFPSSIDKGAPLRIVIFTRY